MKTLKVGLLPLYLQLYDDTCEYMRPRIEAFYAKVQGLLIEKGADVITYPLCRNKTEFENAIKKFEKEQVCAIVTLHLSYSPSLECIDALAGTALPLIVLDTTETFAFSHTTSPDEIMFNHGIHGVQDMCNLLIRRHKQFSIFAGHYLESNVLCEVWSAIRAAAAASALRNARVGLIGDPFAGMGDFRVPFKELNNQIGIVTVPYDMKRGAKYIAAIDKEEINAEFLDSCDQLHLDSELPWDVYERSARTALGIRHWIKQERLSAFSINFLATADSPSGLPVMPFTECSRAMSRGIGYAGEGDVLTAGFVGALLNIFPDASFSEMFCPDWKGNSVFLSHMGEINYLSCAEKPHLTEKDFPFTNAENPTVAYGTLKAGKACFVNLAPLDGQFRIIIAPGHMLDVPPKHMLSNSISGWFRPAVDLTDFLSEYSRSGGTHHGVIVYTEDIEPLKLFASYMNFDTVVV